MGLGDDFGGQVEPFTEVVEALWGKGVVVPILFIRDMSRIILAVIGHVPLP